MKVLLIILWFVFIVFGEIQNASNKKSEYLRNRSNANQRLCVLTQDIFTNHYSHHNNTKQYLLKLDSIVTIDTAKSEYIYDATGNVNQIITSLWNSGKWVKNFKSEFLYDTNGNCVLYIKYWWVSNYWLATDKAEFKYNNNNNLFIVYTYTDFPRSLVYVNDWKYNVKYEYEYTNNNHLKSLTGYKWSAAQWEISDKNEYTTNNVGRITLLTNYSWEDEQWKNAMKIEYMYNGNGNLTQKTLIAWVLDKWENFEKFNYAYNINGNTTMYSRSGWGASNWFNHEKIDYTYDGNNNMILSNTYRWKNNQWNNYEKSTVTYDQSINYLDVAFPQEYNPPVMYSPIIKWYGSYSNKQDSGIVYSWDTTTNNWDSGIKIYYYYSPFVIPIINENSSKKIDKTAPIIVNTNNTNTVLFIRNNEERVVTLEIYSINGRMVKKVIIPSHGATQNISRLSPGAYWIKLSDKGLFSYITSFVKW